MIRDITLGQYYPARSAIHALDPRTKLMITFVYFLSLFLANNKYMYLLSILFFVLYWALSKVPILYILRGLKGIFLFLLMTIVLNMFFTKGDPWIDFWIIHISYQGVRTAVYTCIRLVLLVLGSSIMTYTTTPTKLTDGLEHGFRWMKPFHVPIHELAMMVGIALRFIPILVSELDRIMKAQMARGAEFEQGNLFKRIKALFPVLLPMFISAIRRADELSTAMEARCYRGGEGRTKYKPLHYTFADAIAYLILLIYVVSLVVLRFQTSWLITYLPG